MSRTLWSASQRDGGGEAAVGTHRIEGGQAVEAAGLAVDLTEGRGQVHDAGSLVGLDEGAGHHPPAVAVERAAGLRHQVVEGTLVAQPDQVPSGKAVIDDGVLPEDLGHQVGRHDGPVHHGVLQVGAYGGAGVGHQGPRGGGPGHQGQPVREDRPRVARRAAATSPSSVRGRRT